MQYTNTESGYAYFALSYPEIFHDPSYWACSWHVDLHDVPCDTSYCKEDVEI